MVKYYLFYPSTRHGTAQHLSALGGDEEARLHCYISTKNTVQSCVMPISNRKITNLQPPLLKTSIIHHIFTDRRLKSQQHQQPTAPNNLPKALAAHTSCPKLQLTLAAEHLDTGGLGVAHTVCSRVSCLSVEQPTPFAFGTALALRLQNKSSHCSACV